MLSLSLFIFCEYKRSSSKGKGKGKGKEKEEKNERESCKRMAKTERSDGRIAITVQGVEVMGVVYNSMIICYIAIPGDKLMSIERIAFTAI